MPRFARNDIRGFRTSIIYVKNINGEHMDYIKLTIETTGEGVELVTGLLLQMGIYGLTIDDPQDLIDIMRSSSGVYWDYVDESLLNRPPAAYVHLFLTNDSGGREQIAEIQNALSWLAENENNIDVGTLSTTVADVDGEDWANSWKKYYKPFQIGEKLIIKPSWAELAVLEIDPGMAFGTGTHESTKMCLELIQEYDLNGKTVLDIGTGSGILGISALLLGAESCLAVDIDKNCVATAIDNAGKNHVKDRFKAVTGDLVQAVNGKFDIIFANIVADAIIALAGSVRDYMKDGAVFISSGIINARFEEVKAALTENGFEIQKIKTENDWLALAAYAHEL